MQFHPHHVNSFKFKVKLVIGEYDDEFGEHFQPPSFILWNFEASSAIYYFSHQNENKN